MVARPTKPSPLGSSSSLNACSGGRYRSVVPTTRNGSLKGPIRVTPDVPSMCLLIGTGGRTPLSRSTRQSPSSEPTATTRAQRNPLGRQGVTKDPQQRVGATPDGIPTRRGGEKWAIEPKTTLNERSLSTMRQSGGLG